MRDFIPRFTFSFLMAQLLPGAIAVLFITLPMNALTGTTIPSSLRAPFDCTVGAWFNVRCCGALGGDAAPGRLLVAKAVIFFFAALGVGMVIHGVNWMVLAWLENHCNPDDPQAAWKSFWHGWRPAWQLLVGPIKMATEIVWMLGWARGLRYLAMDENAPKIPDARSRMFAFVQDFYLPFAQFYAHTAYALLLGLLCLLVFAFAAPMRFVAAAVELAILYLLTSMLFLIGRVQFATLCTAEHGFLGVAHGDEEEGQLPPGDAEAEEEEI